MRGARCCIARVFDRSFDGTSFDAHEGPMRCCLAVPRSNDCQTVADTRRVVGSCWLCGAHRIHTGLGSPASSLIAHVLHSPPPPREQLCNRSCSNKTHTHIFPGLSNLPVCLLVWMILLTRTQSHKVTKSSARNTSDNRDPFTRKSPG